MNEIAKEILVGIAKSTISVIPYGAGNFLNECFEIRGRIVQKRVHDFTDSLIKYINYLGIKIDKKNLESEQFNDIFISIIKHVANTKCEYKIKIFQDILIKNVIEPYESNFIETFLDLVIKLDYLQIEILKLHQNTGRSGYKDIPDGAYGYVKVLTSVSYKKQILDTIKKALPNLTSIQIEGKYEFYICDLISKSLLIDSKTIERTWDANDRDAFTQLYITDFGKEFIEYIKKGF